MVSQIEHCLAGDLEREGRPEAIAGPRKIAKMPGAGLRDACATMLDRPGEQRTGPLAWESGKHAKAGPEQLKVFEDQQQPRR